MVHTQLVPSYGEMTVRLNVAGMELALFEVRGAEALRIVADQWHEKLVAKFESSHQLDDFVLQLKPRVRITWGNRQVP